MPHFWRYEEVDVRDDVKTALPDGWRMQVFKVTSGDTGKLYYVQVLKERSDETHIIFLCNCPEGTFRAPLEVLGIERACKHAENLHAFLKETRR